MQQKGNGHTSILVLSCCLIPLPGEGGVEVPQIWATGGKAYPHRFYINTGCSIIDKRYGEALFLRGDYFIGGDGGGLYDRDLV
jgi:hypothetical protein